MRTDAQRRAEAAYRKRSTRQIVVRCYPGDEELYEWVRSKGNATDYIKGLVRADMERTASEVDI